MRRAQMNFVKGKWKDFIMWFINEQGYSNLRISKCEISQIIYYPNNLRHDPDNSVPKFILDGFVESGLLTDDDSKHIRKLSLQCEVDKAHPRTEIRIAKIELEENKENDDGKEN